MPWEKMPAFEVRHRHHLRRSLTYLVAFAGSKVYWNSQRRSETNAGTAHRVPTARLKILHHRGINMNRRQWLKRSAALALAMWALAGLNVQAEQEFKPNVDLSDGKGGRPFKKWVQTVKERPVKKVAVNVQRTSGGDDTFINLRFGDKGKTFENGKRVYLKSGEKRRVEFLVNTETPNGRPLVLNAYNGVVKLRWVGVYYQ